MNGELRKKWETKTHKKLPPVSEQGYTTYTCVLCGDSYVSDYTDPVTLNSYRWEMQDNALVSVTTGGNTSNVLTRNSGCLILTLD